MIDLDHNASTSLDPRVREAMQAALDLGNPSSTHARGREARRVLDDARRKVAELVGSEPAEVVFTASGSEANALGLEGAFLARRKVSARVLLSAVEHPSVRAAAKKVATLGAEVVELPVNGQGLVRLASVEQELQRGAAVIALMWANNETGVVQPTPDVERLATAAGVPYLCDAVQVPGKLRLTRLTDRAHLVTLSAHKFHGPQGSAALIVRRGVQLVPVVGGHQERGRRGGTENVAAAVGFAKALELLSGDEATPVAVRALRDRFERELLARFPDARINGAGAERVGNTSSVTFPGVDGEALVIALDLAGVSVSLGAACASGAVEPSHVLLAMGLSPADARASLRFSFGRENTAADVDRVLQLLGDLVPAARR